MTYKIDTCHYLAWRLALIGWGMDWLGQDQDNVTEWEIGSWCKHPRLQWGQHHKVTRVTSGSMS